MLLLFLIFPNSAHAYLDPGTGSALVYAIFGLSFAIFYTIKGYFYSFTGLIFKTKIKHLHKDIIFFTEGGQYKNTFIPITRALDDRNISYKIFTIDKNDEILKNKNAEFIGNGAYAFAFLNSLSAKIVVMTTPQLDVLQLKKSKKVRHYAHVVHSATDISFYKRYAFDHFDSVFISGSHQENTIRDIEKLRGFKPKQIVKAGLCYFDEMIKTVKPVHRVSDNKTLLIAPSWGTNGVFTLHGINFLKTFINTDFHIIIRPHPQIKISQKDIFDELEALTQEVKNFELDTKSTPEDALSRADFLLSDFSGIIFDFAFLKEMPVFIFDYQSNTKGYEAEDLPNNKIWEFEAIKEIGIMIKKDDLDNLLNFINNIDISIFKKKILDIKSSSLYNIGNAGEKTAEEILKICSTL